MSFTFFLRRRQVYLKRIPNLFPYFFASRTTTSDDQTFVTEIQLIPRLNGKGCPRRPRASPHAAHAARRRRHRVRYSDETAANRYVSVSVWHGATENGP